MKEKFKKYLTGSILFILGVLFVAKFAGASFLKLYVEIGVGTCKNIPILCMKPTGQLKDLVIDENFKAGLIPYGFPGIQAMFPKGFRVVKEEIKKPYYKEGRLQPKKREQAAYLIAKREGFFTNLFPEVLKQGISNNYAFYTRVINADINGIRNLTDVFFVVMKSIFIPDMGYQPNVQIKSFTDGARKGFILYNFSATGNFFDCCIFDNQDNFFKVYIRDGNCMLDLDKFYTIVSSVKVNNP